MANYLEIISEYYPDTQVDTVGLPSDYNAINWVTAQIAQNDLDDAHLVHHKTEKLTEYSTLAGLEITAGFKSTALGYGHWYDSEIEDQMNLIGSVAKASDTYYSCRDYTRAVSTVDVSGGALDATATGYANDSTNYTAEIKVNGTSTYISFLGENAQTYAELIAILNGDVDFSALGSAELVAGNINVYSLLRGVTATIELIDTNVFSALTTFISIGDPVDGIDGKYNPEKEYNLHTPAELMIVINDGADFKLTILQKFNVKKGQVLAAIDEAAVDAIIWE